MKHVKEMVAEANEVVEVISAEEAVAMHGRDGVTFIDIRDVRELWRTGKAEGAKHVSRGMLEFWADPESPYFKDGLFPTGSDGKKCYLY